MNYYERNYKEIYEILDKNKGTLEAKYVEDIFYAFQIASGQGYFYAKIKAIMDYFHEHSLLVIEYPDKQIELHNLDDLEKCFQNHHDRKFKLADLK